MPEAPKENNNIKIIENATCTFCGCVCDDQILHVDTKENKIVKTLNSCVLGKAWFAEHSLDTSLPECLIDGKKATYEEGITEAARVLTDAKFPIVYGLSDTTAEAQREAVAIADWVGGNLDTTTSVCHGPSGIAFEGVGESTSTLGEMKNRSDVVVFWGGNPAESHPRLFPHYVGTPKGRFTPNGRDDRIFILADTRTTPSRRFLREEEKGGKDIFLQIKPGKDFEVLWTLRALVKGKKASNYNEEETGIPFKTLEKIKDIVLKAKYPTFLFGMGLTMTRGRHFNSGAVLALATDLNGLPGKKMYGFGLDLGVMASLREKVVLGVFIKNINSPRIGRGSNAQFLPRRLNIGCSYHPSKSLKTSFVYERILYNDTNQFRFGVEYEFHKYFILRTGVQMKPNRFGFGFLSPVSDKISIAYGLITHPILPLTHNAEFGLNF